MSEGAERVFWGWCDVDADGARAAGRRAAHVALEQLGPDFALAYAGARPVVDGANISISHGRRRAVAVAARRKLGIDLCELDRGPRIRSFATRYFSADECALIATDQDAVALWAAKEAGLKALGLGLLDGGAFDDPDLAPVQVCSLAPPSYAKPAGFSLTVVEHDDALVALAVQTAPSTTTVAPFM